MKLIDYFYNFLVKFFIKNNPKNGKNKEIHEKFLIYLEKKEKVENFKNSEILNKKVLIF